MISKSDPPTPSLMVTEGLVWIHCHPEDRISKGLCVYPLSSPITSLKTDFIVPENDKSPSDLKELIYKEIKDKKEP